MKISKHNQQCLNDHIIRNDIDYKKGNNYILAIKEDGDWSNVYPIIYLVNDDYWGINKDDIEKINISRSGINIANHELVIVGGRCYSNLDSRYSHYVYGNYVYEIEAESNIICDIFAGIIDYNNNTVKFENDLYDLYEKYIQNQKPFYIIDSSFIVGPFTIKSMEGNLYIIKKHQHNAIHKTPYNPDYIFEPEQDNYTNNIKRFFLFSEDKSDLFKNSEEIDFISNKELLEWIREEYKKHDSQAVEHSDTILLLYQWTEKTTEIKANTSRYNRFIELKDSFNDYSETISKFIDLVPEIKNIKEEIEKINNEKDSLTQEKDKLNNEKKTLKEDCDEKRNERKELDGEIKSLENKKTEYQEEIEKRYNEEKRTLLEEIGELNKSKANISDTIVKEYNEAKVDVLKLEEHNNYLEKRKAELERVIDRLSKEFIREQENAHEQLSELVKSKTHFDFIRGKRFSDTKNNSEYKYDYELRDQVPFDSYEELRNKIITVFNSQNRRCDEHFIDNLLISTCQNLFTLFVGLPGTGKTSMARLISTCLSGKERRTEVSVGRGWTSHKEFLGFYNPLSGNFIETHKGLYKKLQDLGHEFIENKSGDCPIQYIILDEANLSPIEHYWSMFINDTDRDINGDFEIDLGDGGLIKHHNAIRFIGTINNDHTTERLSPRILDRVNLVYFKPEDINQFNSTELIEELCISKKQLELFLQPNNALEINYSEDARFIEQKIIYKEIKNHLKEEMQIYLSPRIDIAMERYCKVANMYMKERFRPLDYVIAQRILPLISNGKKEPLEVLKEKLVKLKLNKSVSFDILEQIIKQGEKDFGMYEYFSILGY